VDAANHEELPLGGRVPDFERPERAAADRMADQVRPPRRLGAIGAGDGGRQLACRKAREQRENDDPSAPARWRESDTVLRSESVNSYSSSISEEQRMPRSIVVATDGSEPAERAVQEAIAIAAREGARLHVVTAYPDPHMFRERITSGATEVPVRLREVAESVLARAAREAENQGVEVETHAREGEPAEAIIGLANEQQADLIVVGNRGLTGIRRFLLGSVSSKVSEHAPCSVMIVRPD
jgi:nucleotide-binding universal stress UspA family protein